MCCCHINQFCEAYCRLLQHLDAIIAKAGLIRELEGKSLDELEDMPPAYRDEIDCVWQCLCLAVQAAGWFRTQAAAASLPSANADNNVSKMWEYPLLQGVIEFGERQLYFEKVLQESAADDLTRLDPLGRTALAVALEMAHNMEEYSDRDTTMRNGIRAKWRPSGA